MSDSAQGAITVNTQTRSTGCNVTDAKLVSNSDLYQLLERASILRGLIVAADEIGVHEPDNEELALAVSALMIEARDQVKSLTKEIKVLLRA
jgi:hypothetical protein